MQIYKNLIWLSALLMIGEGLVLSGFEFVPINAKDSLVLGETTSIWLEGIESQLFPASYYIALPEDNLQTDDSLQNQEVKPEPAAQNEHTKKSDLKQMIEFLNVPSDNELSIKIKQQSGDSDAISTLIDKNKRVYLRGLKKELDKISQGLDY